MEETYRITINNHPFRFDCRSWGTRSGFAHGAELIETGMWYRLAEAKRFYLNRTWECYNFQSAMLDAIENAKSAEIDREKERLFRLNGWERMTAKRREALDKALAENELFTTLKALYEEVKKCHPAWERWEYVRVE